MQEHIIEVKVPKNASNYPKALQMMRKMVLDDIGKAGVKNLHQYYKLFSELNGYKSHHDDIFENYYDFKNTEKEYISMVTTKLYDYKKLVQYDAESESIRREDDAPNVLHFLAYALNKHDKGELDAEAAIGRSREINEKVLNTFFYMAVAAGWNMALENEK